MDFEAGLDFEELAAWVDQQLALSNGYTLRPGEFTAKQYWRSLNNEIGERAAKDRLDKLADVGKLNRKRVLLNRVYTCVYSRAEE